jgi:hypothetical protein
LATFTPDDCNRQLSSLRGFNYAQPECWLNVLIQRERVGTPVELEAILANAKDLRLTPGERNQIGFDLSIFVAHRARQIEGRRDDPNERFIAETLGLISTPAWFGRARVGRWTATRRRSDIARCPRHKPPGCGCWSSQRAILWQVQSAHGDKSPEGFAAAKIYASLEELETASGPDPSPGVM